MSPALGDITGDSKMELVFSDSNNMLYVADATTGSLLWNYTANYAITCSPTLVDLNGDGKVDPCFTTKNGFVHVVNGMDGNILWSKYINSYVASGKLISASDLNGDDVPDLVVPAIDGFLTMLDGNDGEIVWRYALESYESPNAIIVDLDPTDNTKEIVCVNSDVYLTILDGEWGNKIQSIHVDMFNDVSAIGDIDCDGHPEAIINCGMDGIKAVELDSGRRKKDPIIWTINLGSDCSFPVLGDVNGNRRLEVIVGSYDGSIYVIDPITQEFLYTIYIGNPFHATPVLYDLDGDNTLEIVCAGLTDTSTIVAIKTTGFSDVSLIKYWWMYGGNSFHTCDMTSFDHDADGASNDAETIIMGTNEWVWDTDFDGLNDWIEYALLQTSPTNNDTDGNGVNDFDEDQDGDLISNGHEVNILETDPTRWDTDEDGISDGEEDFDMDGLSNEKELGVYSTDPLSIDTDHDNLEDGLEVSIGTNPLSHDSDEDGLNDGDEYYNKGTSPTNYDTDGDGYSDGDEVYYWKSDPLDPSDPSRYLGEPVVTVPGFRFIDLVLVNFLIGFLFFKRKKKKQHEYNHQRI